MRAKSVSEVLIVGAGPTGLTTAIEMKRRGIPCRVIEKLPEPSDKSKALAIHARSLEMLENMGVVKQLIDAGIKAFGFTMYTGKQRLMSFSTAELDAPFPFILMIPQQETERVLREHFEKLGGKIERAVELTALQQDKNEVTVQLKHADGKEETFKTPWVLACDGSHSTVRKQLGLKFEGAAYEERFALGDVDIESDLREDEVTTYFHQDGPMVFFPMGNKRFRLMAPVEEAQVVGDQPTMQFLESLAKTRCGEQFKFVRSHWLAWFRIHRRSVQDYRVGRVFLSGDSAHIHSPVGGQGMNTGMQDVYNLAWKLELVYKNLAAPELLDSYQEERHPVGQELLKGTDLATRAAVLRNPVAKFVRNQMITFIGQQEFAQEKLRNVGTMMSVNYRGSKLVGEYHEIGDVRVHVADNAESPNLPTWMEFARAPLPGDRAPDTVLLDKDNNEKRLFEIIQGTKHNLVLFDGKPTPEGYKTLEKIAQAIKEQFGEIVDTHIVVAGTSAPDALKNVPNVYCDPDLVAHEKYGAQSEALYLIRPDGFIGFRSQPAKLEPLVAHLNKLLGKTVATAAR
jgi:2-polyprenyl-6-methoxyphenol hydroxylase-like FAD-dependent oxidoreductase